MGLNDDPKISVKKNGLRLNKNNSQNEITVK